MLALVHVFRIPGCYTYPSLLFARLASGTKQGSGYVVVEFTAILITGLHRQPVGLAKQGFIRWITEKQPGQVCYEVGGHGYNWCESTALVGCLDLAKVRAAAAAPANHSEQISI